MPALRRFGKVAVAFALAAALAVALLPRIPPPASAADAPAPPLPVPEDPLGQKPEKEIPEISVAVDVRDGHLTTRVVDIWGPGRTPLVLRSYTNTVATSPIPVQWHFVHDLQVRVSRWPPPPPEPFALPRAIIESDGNESRYRYSHTRWNGPTEKWDVYVDEIGTYTTMEIHYTNCTPEECTWDGLHTVYLPKGVSRRFSQYLLQEERDANGNVTTFTWTTFADQIRPYIGSVRDPVGRTITYNYEQSHQECVLEGELFCLVWKWHYRVRTITDPYGRTATYTYNGARQLASVNVGGFTTSYTYDAFSRLTSVTNARQHTTTVQWTTLWNQGRVTQVTLPDQSATTYTYSCCGGTGGIYRTVVGNARGYSTTYDLYIGEDQNYAGNVERITNPLGQVTQYAYNARHNVIQVTDPRGIPTTYAYNGRNRLTQIVKAAGSLNLTTTLTWDGNDNLLSVTNPRGIRTDYTYNGQHNLISVRPAVGTADESVTQYGYTLWGGVAWMIDPRGNTTNYTYTARRQLASIIPPAGGTTSFTYDAADNLSTRTDGNGGIWTNGYDSRRLVTDTWDPAGNRISYGYDANGNRTSVTDARLNNTWFAYDSRDRLVTITDPLAGSTTYSYDAVSNLTRIINARVHTTTFAYDAANRLIQTTDPLGQSATYAYDPAGNRTEMRDRRGFLHTFLYDQASRLTQVGAGGVVITYTYDAGGNRLTQADSTGTTEYQYDALDRLTRTRYPDFRTVQFSYDRAGNRTGLINPGGILTTYDFDGANRLTQMTQGTRVWAFNYDNAGNRTQMMHPNGTRTVYVYFPNNWLRGTIQYDPSGVVQEPGSVEYAYDANGNRITQCDLSGCATLTYDALNRLTSAAYQGGYGTWTWVYDAVGNRIQQIAPAGVTNYGYDANNRLTSAGATTYAYDPDGNLTSISTGQTFTWDALNRMTQATGPGGTVTFTYNGDGHKIRRVGPEGTTHYYYDGIRSLWETDEAGNLTAQLDRDLFGNLLSWMEASGALWYAHHDGLGSTAALTDPSGAVLFSMLYDAWGNVRAGTPHGRYLFTGAEHGAATGLYHMGARFYDPTIGRWLSEDPAENNHYEPATLNSYAYVNANPVVLVDTDGQTAAVAALALGFAVPGVGQVLVVAVGVAALGIIAYEASQLISETRAERRAKGLGLAVDDALRHLTDHDIEMVSKGRPGHIEEVNNAVVRLGRVIKALEKERDKPNRTPEQKKEIQKKIDQAKEAEKKGKKALEQAPAPAPPGQ